MTITVKHQWISHTSEVDFLKNKGGHFGGALAITAKNAEKLAKDLNQCVDNAKKNGKASIELVAHWGKKGPEGFLLRTRVKQE